jgi:hypothetical protein
MSIAATFSMHIVCRHFSMHIRPVGFPRITGGRQLAVSQGNWVLLVLSLYDEMLFVYEFVAFNRFAIVYQNWSSKSGSMSISV